MNDISSGAVKLSCRDVWKVYGDDPDRYFDKRSGRVEDPAGLADQIRSEDHIVARNGSYPRRSSYYSLFHLKYMRLNITES